MAKNKKESFFWTSYSDLMTSLFFIMLVLFVLSIAMLHKRNIATQEELNHIRRLEQSIENINSRYFIYDDKHKRHTLKDINVTFNKGSADIRDIPGDQRIKLLEAGKSIREFIKVTKDTIPDAQYLLIVEGQSSKDNYDIDEYFNNDVLSYQRALSLVKLWANEEIIFNDEACEVIVSGSGQNSLFRVEPDNQDNRANQRFVIHIIPKPGAIKKKEDKED
jgi:flagellar motor protein MotB